MHRLLSLKLASNLPKTLSSSTTTTTRSSLFHFQPHKAFSLTKPPQTQSQNHLFSSITTHPLYHQHKVHGFISNPLPRKHFSLRLSDCRRGFHQTQFLKQSFNSKPSQNSHQGVKRSSWFQRVSSNDMVLGLIAANVVVFCLWQISDFGFMYRNFTLSLVQFDLARVHTLITSEFSHRNIGHVVSNMLGLYIFGTNIGRVFGPGFLLKLYLAGGIAGSVFLLVHQFYLFSLPETIPISKLLNSLDITHMTHPFVFPTLGASGAVTATILLDIFLHPTARLYFVIPVPSMLLGMFLLGQDFLRVNTGYLFLSGSSHLGGATVAAIVWVWTRLGKRRCLV